MINLLTPQPCLQDWDNPMTGKRRKNKKKN